LVRHIRWDPRWSFDGTVQFNPKMSAAPCARRLVGATARASFRTIGLAYRYQRELSEQIDLGWQWPLNDLWGDRAKDLGAGQGEGCRALVQRGPSELQHERAQAGGLGAGR
jgi:LPS-assembly protein